MAVCPHTHSPPRHEAAIVRRSLGMLCGTCRSSLRECSSCGAIARSAADFCSACGSRIGDTVDERVILPPGRIRDFIATSRPRSLRDGAALASGEQPIFWCICDVGVLAISSRAGLSPTRVSHLDLLDAGRSRDLTVSWPPADLWLGEPLITRHGAFAVTPSGVHGLAFHGFDRMGESVFWAPESGEIVTAFSRGDGFCVALVREFDGGVTAYAGNGQAPEWTRIWTLDRRLDPAAAILAGAVPPVTGGGSEEIWLLSGGTLLVVGSDTGVTRLALDAQDGSPISPFVNRRLGAGRFEPFAVELDSGVPHVLFPVGGASLSVGVLALKPAAVVQRIADISPTGWLALHPGSNGLLLGDASVLRLFHKTTTFSTHDLRSGRFSSSPILSGHALIGLVERQTRPGMAANTELILLDLPDFGRTSTTDVRTILREPLPGIAVPGLPPLLAGHSVLVALQDERGDIMVHSIRIHDSAGVPA